MAEQKISIESKELRLEGLLEDRQTERGVVVTHPHPLYGGDMYNNVVQAVVEGYKRKGYSTLRFNFRGVGGSEGDYDQGKGEQDDVEAAVSFLARSGRTRIHLAGYSFGAWVNAMALERLEAVERVVMVSPPVNFLDFSGVAASPKIRLIIAGSRDAFASMGTIEALLPGWNKDARLEGIQGADHFYWGREQEIASLIEAFLDSNEG